jgi:hypothetical protein
MILYGKIPEVVGKYQGKKLLVCGAARCLWEDLAQISVQDYEIMVVNAAGLYLPYMITHWFSGYYTTLGAFKKIRTSEYHVAFEGREKIITHSRFYYPGVDYVWKAEKWGFGTSTLDACSIGLLMGYDRVVLAGAPLDNTGHFYDPPGQKGGEGVHDIEKMHQYYKPEWEWWNKTYFDNRVKSLSGLTKEICGGLEDD